MFSFLKDKLKTVVDKFSKKVDEVGKEEITELEVKKKSKTTPKPKVEKKETTKKLEKKEERNVKKDKEKKLNKDKENKTEEVTTKESISTPEKSSDEVFEDLSKINEPEEKVSIDNLGLPEEKVPEESEESVKEEIAILEGEEKETKKGFFSRLFKKKDKALEVDQSEEVASQEENQAAIDQEVKEETPSLEDKEEPPSPEEESKGFFSFIKEKVTTKKISVEQFEELFWDLELALLESNVAVEVIEKIKLDLKEKLANQPLKKSEINNIIVDSLRESIENILQIESFNLIEKIKQKKPCVICFIGINGSGKTTTIAKVANLLQKNKISCCLAAADTFRAAAIQQLEEHALNLNLKIIKHDYGADSASVAFDAIKHAEARHLDAVLIDTAGRLHSNDDLMKEMQKIIKVAKPDLKIFIGESITGNDCVEQAKKFNELIGIDGIILSKADIDDKGGAAISVSFITQKPILFLGTGQTYDDLKEFNKADIVKSLGL